MAERKLTLRSKPLNARITFETWEMLTVEAARAGRSRSQVAEQMIIRGLAETAKERAAMSAAFGHPAPAGPFAASPSEPPHPDGLLSWKEVRPLVGNLGRTTWWRMMASGRAPKPINLSPGRVAWRRSDIARFQASLRAAKHYAERPDEWTAMKQAITGLDCPVAEVFSFPDGDPQPLPHHNPERHDQ